MFLRASSAQLFFDRPRHRSPLATGVLRRNRFDQRNPRLFGSRSIVSHAARHDEKLTRLQGHRATVGLGPADGERAAKHEKHLIFCGMRVPGELPLHPHYFDELIVDAAKDSRRPQRFESAAGRFQRNGLLLHCRARTRLVPEAGRDRNLVAALGAAAVEYSRTGLGGHADEKAVDLATAAAVGLEGALGHGKNPVWRMLCALGLRVSRTTARESMGKYTFEKATEQADHA
jgi:hypothetical protein